MSEQSHAMSTIENWTERASSFNDEYLNSAFESLVETSASLPPAQRVVMYDACDEHEVASMLGPLRRRLDARRNTKPKQAKPQLSVCTPFDPADFKCVDRESNVGPSLIALLTEPAFVPHPASRRSRTRGSGWPRSASRATPSAKPYSAEARYAKVPCSPKSAWRSTAAASRPGLLTRCLQRTLSRAAARS